MRNERYPLLSALLGPTSAKARPQITPDAALEAALGKILAETCAAWPQISLDTQTFLSALSTELADIDSAERLLALDWPDLYFAQACLASDAWALACFRKDFLGPLRPMLGRRFEPNVVEESLHQLELDLLVGLDKRAPVLAQFAGRSKLKTWLRTVAMRAALQYVRGTKKERGHASDDVLDKIAGSGNDPELDVLRMRYAQTFKEAVSQAIVGLPERDRTILNQYYVDGLSFTQMAKIYGVDASRPSRWLKKARTQVLAETRRQIMAQLKLTTGQCDSFMGELDSQIGLSLTRLFRPK